MQRLLVIGPCGAGKSTLATELGARLGLPVYHVDQLNWLPGWNEIGDIALAEKLTKIVTTDRWLIDGNYRETLGLRLDYADTVVYLDYRISLCIWRLMRRIFRYRGRSRPDMTEGCPERFDFSFLLYLLRWNSGPRVRTEQCLKGHEAKIVRLKRPDQLKRWLDEKVN